MNERQIRMTKMGLVVATETSQRIVLMNESAVREFSDANGVQKVRIAGVMKLWSEGHNLTSEQYNGNEGRAQKGSINKLVGAFKTHKVRVYGFERRLFGKRAFIAVSCDPQKKADRAKVRVLDGAKSRIIAFEESFGGKDED